MRGRGKMEKQSSNEYEQKRYTSLRKRARVEEKEVKSEMEEEADEEEE